MSASITSASSGPTRRSRTSACMCATTRRSSACRSPRSERPKPPSAPSVSGAGGGLLALGYPLQKIAFRSFRFPFEQFDARRLQARSGGELAERFILLSDALGLFVRVALASFRGQGEKSGRQAEVARPHEV